jgi:hypothetical protein
MVILNNCTDYQERVNFFDGAYFKYDLGGKFERIYNIKNISEEQFKVTETNKRGFLSDKTEEIFVDIYGKVYKSTYSGVKGTFSPIWLPTHEMKIGETLNYLEGDKYLVSENKKWEKWDVLVVKNISFGYERYYEKNTGYWVGSSSNDSKFILINTNADIPTIEE